MQAKKKKHTPAKQDTVVLSEHSKRRVVFNELFARSERYTAMETATPPVLNPYAWTDLNLFSGSTANPSFNLISRLNKTSTTLGEGALATLLATPVASIPELQKRQATLRCLLQEDQAYDALKRQLADFRRAEEGLLSFWTDTDPLYINEYNKYMNNRFYTGKTKVAQNATALQWRKIVKRDIWNIGLKFTGYPITGLVLAEITSLCAVKKMSRKEAYDYLFLDWIPLYNLFHTRKNIQQIKEQNAADCVRFGRTVQQRSYWGLYVPPTLITLHAAWESYQGYSNYKEYAAVLRNLAKRMADVQRFIHIVDNMSETVANVPKARGNVWCPSNVYSGTSTVEKRRYTHGQLLHP